MKRVCFQFITIFPVKEGYIDEFYLDNAKKAYLGTLEHLIKVREDGSYEYYVTEKLRDNDPKDRNGNSGHGTYCFKLTLLAGVKILTF